MTDQPMVCVVDDDAAVRNALTRLLQCRGYRVLAYPSAIALLGQAPSERVPTVVLTDLKMPEIDGIALAERLMAEQTTFAIVFLSGHGDVPSAVRAIQDGAVDFLEKPARDDELFEALERAVRRSRDRMSLMEEIGQLRVRYETLTPREREVCALIVAGMINKEAAWELGISEKTIKVHRARVVEKMKAQSLPELVRMVGRLGIPISGATSSAAA